VFEIRDVAGSSTDLLISNRDLGRSFAESFSGAKVMLMRGHGYTVLGDNVRQAVFRAVFTQKNAQAQLAAHHLGAPIFLTEEESAAGEQITAVPVARLWDLWAREVSS
jgi:HCOMODA/2-hydroxy-3-carboxy-muconic semialdehyde decarboxylase